jgi:probable lipoprotein NlpC
MAAGGCIVAFCGCVTSTVRYGRPALPAAALQGGLVYDSAAAKVRGPVDQDRLKKTLDSYLGTPYQWGGMSKKGIDCSGLVCLVFREMYNSALPRSAVDMVKLGMAVQPADLRPGDLVFFRWGFFGTVDHVGIYIGEKHFVHASSKLGVIESSLNDDYYRSHFIAARRLFQ